MDSITNSNSKARLILFFLTFFLILLFISRNSGGEQYKQAIGDYLAEHNIAVDKTEDEAKTLGSLKTKPVQEQDQEMLPITKIDDDHVDEANSSHNLSNDEEDYFELKLRKDNFNEKLSALRNVGEEIESFKIHIDLIESELLGILNDGKVSDSSRVQLNENSKSTILNSINNLRKGSESSKQEIETLLKYFRNILSNSTIK